MPFERADFRLRPNSDIGTATKDLSPKPGRGRVTIAAVFAMTSQGSA
jgi:hypothetical protein